MAKRRSGRRRRKNLFWTACGLMAAAGILLILSLVLLFGVEKDKEETIGSQVESVEPDEPGEEEPAISGTETESTQTMTEPEEEIRIRTVKEVSTETKEQTTGIDVSEFQGHISWPEVAAAGFDYVMVRCGYRTAGSGVIKEDACARYNLQEAHANGIQLGAYFFSTATTEEEAREEARWMCDLLEGYPITYPVAYNCEGFQNNTSRQYGMTVEERSRMAEVFLDEMEANGYTGMFYAARNELVNDTLWMTGDLELQYRIWVAQYSETMTSVPDYDGEYVMWQYTNQGTVPGIEGHVDLDIAWIGYSETASAKKEGAAQKVEANLEAGVDFEEVQEEVTAKDVTNLRSSMDQSGSGNIVGKLRNGETAVRTGKGNNGWSRLEYNGQRVYAVSSYLTTDLGYTAPQAQPDDGFNQTFTIVSEKVTAKDVTNLRSRPSMEDSDVIVQLHNGEVIIRTGISDMGWSRVEYNGQTLYCIGSYLQKVE